MARAQCSNMTGSTGVIKLREEESFGEFSQSGYTQIPFNSFGVSYSRNEVESDTIKNGRQPTETSLGDISVEGDIVVPLDGKYSHYLLKALTGKYSTSVVDSRNVHKYEITDDCLPSLSFEKSFTATKYNYLIRGAKVNSLSVDFGGEGQVNASFGIMAKSEEMRTVSVDAVEDEIAVDSNINSLTLTVVDGSKFKTDDVVIPRILRGTLSADVAKGNNTLALQAGEGLAFTKGQLVEIKEITYMILSTATDKIVLDRTLETALVVSDSVFLIENAYKVASVAGNVLTLNQGLKNNVITGDKIYTEPAKQSLVSTNFEHGQITLTSDDGDVALALVESVKFSFENNLEGKRYINTKGSYGNFLEGKVKISCELAMTFSAENGKMLEEAKVGKTFNFKIALLTKDGEMFNIVLPTGKLVPAGPSIEGPSAISVTASLSPFGEGIYFELINDETY